MEITFEPLSNKHRKIAIDAYNYYIENSFAAYPEKKMPYAYFHQFMKMTKGYPAFAIKTGEKTVGFCFLRPFSQFPTFRETAEITYFIDKEHTGKGIGAAALDRLEQEARNMGIRVLLASIASENPRSIDFHLNHGFRECGRFEKIITKKGKRFDVVWMQKLID